MTTLLAFLFVLGVLVFIHELGHFLAARRLGVRVLTFSLGFGPKLLKMKRGDTEYCISAIPLGGYVKMAGESPDDPRTGNPDEFLSKTKWERFQILIMGPVMNLLLAVVVTAIVLAQGADVPAYQDDPPVVGAVAPGSPAEKVGIQRGDRILTVAGEDVPSWDKLFLAIGTRPDRDVRGDAASQRTDGLRGRQDRFADALRGRRHRRDAGCASARRLRPRRRSRRQGGHQEGRRRHRRQRRAGDFRPAARRSDVAQRGQADRSDHPAQRRRTAHHRDAREARRSRADRHHHHRGDQAVQAGAGRGGEAERSSATSSSPVSSSGRSAVSSSATRRRVS